MIRYRLYVMRTLLPVPRVGIALALLAATSLVLDAGPAAASVAAGEHALWTSDSYRGAPLDQLTLRSGEVSDWISVGFLNEGPTTSWNQNIVLAQWAGDDDGVPVNGNAGGMFCHDAPHDWWSCDPAIAAWIGYGPVPPGQVGTFTFRVQAPRVDSPQDYTLYFRPARRLRDGTYAWLDARPDDGLPGNRTYEVFTVHVLPIPPCPRCQ
jgi:hypothetical protein